MTRAFTFLAFTYFSFSAFAGFYDAKVNGTTRLYDKIIAQGVPPKALERVFEFLDINGNKVISVKHKFRGILRTYMIERRVQVKQRYAGIIDFTLPSKERRFHVIDLKSGRVQTYFVAHGKGSGVLVPDKFSNIAGSKMSSLGLYITGNTYYGGHGESLNLYGLEASNNRAASRDIVMHGANYVSEDYAKAHHRLGRSWGCPAVSTGIIKKMINTFEEGNVIYVYQKGLMASIKTTPNLQLAKVDDDNEDIDLPEEEETVRGGESEATKADNDDAPIPMPRPNFLNTKVAPIPNERPDSFVSPPEVEVASQPATPVDNHPDSE